MSPEERTILLNFLVSQSLADNLGDIRDAEMKIWEMLGLPRPRWESDDAFADTMRHMEEHGVLPEKHRDWRRDD